MAIRAELKKKINPDGHRKVGDILEKDSGEWVIITKVPDEDNKYFTIQDLKTGQSYFIYALDRYDIYKNAEMTLELKSLLTKHRLLNNAAVQVSRELEELLRKRDIRLT